MEKHLTDPPGKPNVLHIQLVDLFTGASKPETRELVLREFSRPETKLHLLVASTAFGLGVADIVRVVNWGAPNTLEDFVQESGRGGRDGSAEDAMLYPKIIGKHVSKEMKECGDNLTVYRITILFKNFLFSDHSKCLITVGCCDICTPLCMVPASINVQILK